MILLMAPPHNLSHSVNFFLPHLTIFRHFGGLIYRLEILALLLVTKAA